MSMQREKDFLSSFAKGEMVMVYDPHREEEGDFFCLAQFITPEKINFLLTHAKGMICVACHKDLLAQKEIPLMTSPENISDPHKTRFCLSLDAKKGITTGVSASDRAQTIRLLADPQSTNEDFTFPGHTFPLQAESNYQRRFGHTEAAVGLAQKVGAIPAVVICEILDEKGEKASKAYLEAFSKTFSIPLLTLEEVKRFLQP